MGTHPSRRELIGLRPGVQRGIEYTMQNIVVHFLRHSQVAGSMLSLNSCNRLPAVCTLAVDRGSQSVGGTKFYDFSQNVLGCVTDVNITVAYSHMFFSVSCLNLFLPILPKANDKLDKVAQFIHCGQTRSMQSRRVMSYFCPIGCRIVNWVTTHDSRRARTHRRHNSIRQLSNIGLSRPTPRLLSFALCLEWINGIYI